MLSASDIAAMRATIEAALPDTCTIQRATETSDGAGGRTKTWATLASGVKCRLAPDTYRAEEREVAARLTAVTAWVITLPVGQDVAEKDRIVVGSSTYEVAGVSKHGAWELSVRVSCTKVA